MKEIVARLMLLSAPLGLSNSDRTAMEAALTLAYSEGYMAAVADSGILNGKVA